MPAPRTESLRCRGITLVVSTRFRRASLAKTLRHYLARSGLSASQIEVLIFVNPGTQGLSTLYNQVLQQARFDVVCFLHDDLHFLRGARWGLQVLRAFQSTSFAALSAAGSVSLSETGVFWARREHLVGRVRHRLRSRLPSQRTYYSNYSDAFDSPLPVLVLDGLFLAVHRQRLYQAQPFDERFTFHFYDLAFSLRQSLARAGSCGVLTRLQVVHHSLGEPNAAYWQLRARFVKHYGQHLPQFLAPELLPPRRLASVVFQTQGLPRVHSCGLHTLTQTAENDPAWLAGIAPEDGIWIFGGGLVEPQDIPALRDRLWQIFLRGQRMHQLQKLGVLAPRLHYADTRLVYHNGLTLSSAGIIHRGMHQPYRYRLQETPVDAVLACAVLVRGDVFLATLAEQHLARGGDVLEQDPALAWGLQLSAQAHQRGLQVRVSGAVWGLWSEAS